MNMTARLISVAALAATIIPCLLFFAGIIGHETVKASTLAGTVIWFIATPFWMGRELPIDATEVEI